MKRRIEVLQDAARRIAANASNGAEASLVYKEALATLLTLPMDADTSWAAVLHDLYGMRGRLDTAIRAVEELKHSPPVLPPERGGDAS